MRVQSNRGISLPLPKQTANKDMIQPQYKVRIVMSFALNRSRRQALNKQRSLNSKLS